MNFANACPLVYLSLSSIEDRTCHYKGLASCKNIKLSCVLKMWHLARMIDSGTIYLLDISGRGAARAEDAQGTPTQSHISPGILVYEDKHVRADTLVSWAACWSALRVESLEVRV